MRSGLLSFCAAACAAWHLPSPMVVDQPLQPLSISTEIHPSAASQPALQQTSAAASHIFPSPMLIAALQPDWLGKPSANKFNPGGAGNAEGNWWTPSSALDTDCEGNKVTARTVLSQECICAFRPTHRPWMLIGSQHLTSRRYVWQTRRRSPKSRRVNPSPPRMLNTRRERDPREPPLLELLTSCATRLALRSGEEAAGGGGQGSQGGCGAGREARRRRGEASKVRGDVGAEAVAGH